MTRATLIILAVVTVASAGEPATAPGEPTPVASAAGDRYSASLRLNMTYQDAFRAPKDIAEVETETPQSELRDLINQLNRTKIPTRRQVLTEEDFAEPEAPTPAPVGEMKPVVSGEPAPVVAAEVLESVREASPDSLTDPLALAEALFRSGYRAEAYIFYSACFNAAEDGGDRAWMLYQMANCKVYSNPDEAEELFSRVISEFGESDWVQTAKAQVQLMDWMKRNRPRHYLANLKADLEGRKAPEEPVKPAISMKLPAPKPAVETPAPATQPAAAKDDAKTAVKHGTSMDPMMQAAGAVQASLDALAEMDAEEASRD